MQTDRRRWKINCVLDAKPPLPHLGLACSLEAEAKHAMASFEDSSALPAPARSRIDLRPHLRSNIEAQLETHGRMDSSSAHPVIEAGSPPSLPVARAGLFQFSNSTFEIRAHVHRLLPVVRWSVRFHFLPLTKPIYRHRQWCRFAQVGD